MSSLIGTIFLVLAALFIFLIFIVVGIFVVLGGIKFFKAGKELSKVDITDGLDAEELRIISEVFLKKKAAEKEAEVKKKMADAAVL